MKCPIKGTDCFSAHCFINRSFKSFEFGIIACKDADKNSIYFLNKDGEVVKFRTEEKKK